MPTPRTENLDHTLIALAIRPGARSCAGLHAARRASPISRAVRHSFNSVSKHIKLLERADLVARRKAGREYILTFKPKPLNDVQAWIARSRRSGLPRSRRSTTCCVRKTKETYGNDGDTRDRQGHAPLPGVTGARLRRLARAREAEHLDERRAQADGPVGRRQADRGGCARRRKFFFSDMRDAGEAKHWGTYRVLDRPRKIAFTWIVDESQEDEPSIVTITIEPDGTGSFVTIVHERILGVLRGEGRNGLVEHAAQHRCDVSAAVARMSETWGTPARNAQISLTLIRATN